MEAAMGESDDASAVEPEPLPVIDQAPERVARKGCMEIGRREP
jgi:hypothetical protein